MRISGSRQSSCQESEYTYDGDGNPYKKKKREWKEELPDAAVVRAPANALGIDEAAEQLQRLIRETHAHLESP